MTETRPPYATNDDCHTHSRDDDAAVPFWKRAPITVGEWYQLKTQLKQANETIARLTAELKDYQK